jgi:YfiH family protein
MRLFRLFPSPNEAFAPIPLPGAPAGLQAGISLRAAGDLRLESPGREPFFRSLGSPGLSPERVYACRQVHSRRVLALRGQPPVQVAGLEADGLATAFAELLLSVTVADCLPIFVYDRGGRAFALVHSGWQGTGIAAEAVRVLGREFGAQPGSLVAVLGPGIGACCYAVEAGRAAVFRRQYGEQAVREHGGRAFLDLRAANSRLLAEAGVEEQHVHAAAECTACTEELSSFRRDGPAFGRMAAFIGVFRR